MTLMKSAAVAVPLRMTRFYFQPDMPGKGDTFVVLAGRRWTKFLREYIGVLAEPFYERPCLEHEPDSFENMQPSAWIYRSADLLVKDEQRWLTSEQVLTFAAAARNAKDDADRVRALHIDNPEPGAAAVPTLESAPAPISGAQTSSPPHVMPWIFAGSWPTTPAAPPDSTMAHHS